MIAQNAVIVSRLIQIFNDPFIQFLNIDMPIVVEVGLYVLDDLEDDTAGESKVVVLFFTDYVVELGEDMRCPADVLFVDTLDVEEGKMDQLMFIALKGSN